MVGGSSASSSGMSRVAHQTTAIPSETEGDQQQRTLELGLPRRARRRRRGRSAATVAARSRPAVRRLAGARDRSQPHGTDAGLVAAVIDGTGVVGRVRRARAGRSRAISDPCASTAPARRCPPPGDAGLGDRPDPTDRCTAAVVRRSQVIEVADDRRESRRAGPSPNEDNRRARLGHSHDVEQNITRVTRRKNAVSGAAPQAPASCGTPRADKYRLLTLGRVASQVRLGRARTAQEATSRPPGKRCKAWQRSRHI